MLKLTNLITAKFEEALQAKTGWGKNELILLHSKIMVEALSEILTAEINLNAPLTSGNDVLAPIEDKYDTINFSGEATNISDEIDDEIMHNMFINGNINAMEFDSQRGDV